VQQGTHYCDITGGRGSSTMFFSWVYFGLLLWVIMTMMCAGQSWCMVQQQCSRAHTTATSQVGGISATAVLHVDPVQLACCVEGSHCTCSGVTIKESHDCNSTGGRPQYNCVGGSVLLLLARMLK
jgi:hypothetical protein